MCSMLDLTDTTSASSGRAGAGLLLAMWRPGALMVLSPRRPVVCTLQGTGPRVHQGSCPAGSRVSHSQAGQGGWAF